VRRLLATSCVGALLLALASAGVAQAQGAAPSCPAREGASLAKMIYVFATARPDTHAICVYSDGGEASIALAKGCELKPVDVFHDGPPAGGMHECRESAPGRCKIACLPS
jgi:hypothetical protein